MINEDDWNYALGIYNPADLPCKGCSSKQLFESKWWEGPALLKLSSDNWTVSEIKVNDTNVYSVRKKYVAAVGVMVSHSSFRKSLIIRFSNHF